MRRQIPDQGGNHNIGFSTNNLLRMLIKGDGNVIIKQGILEVQSAGNVAETNKILRRISHFYYT